MMDRNSQLLSDIFRKILNHGDTSAQVNTLARDIFHQLRRHPIEYGADRLNDHIYAVDDRHAHRQ